MDLPHHRASDPARAPAAAPSACENRAGEEPTWMTFGLGRDGEDEDRTVTVVFTRAPEDDATTEAFLARPFAPWFPADSRG
jgi:hypothetical protein